MTDRLVIHRDRETQQWLVLRIADEDASRFVAAFPTLLEAESYVDEHGDPHPKDAA